MWQPLIPSLKEGTAENMLQTCPPSLPRWALLGPSASIATHCVHPFSNPDFVLWSGPKQRFPRRISNYNKIKSVCCLQVGGPEFKNSQDLFFLKRVSSGDRDRQISGAHWPGSLAYLVSPQGQWETLFQNSSIRREGRTWEEMAPLASTCIHTCLLVHSHPCTCTYTSTHSKTHFM